MGMLGWSYPPGAENDPSAPYNQDCGDDELPTIEEFMDHIGIEPLSSCLRAIDKYNTEHVWLTLSDGQKLMYDSKHLDDFDPETSTISIISVSGSDWEWTGTVDCASSPDWACELDEQREAFHEALNEHDAQMEAEYDEE